MLAGSRHEGIRVEQVRLIVAAASAALAAALVVVDAAPATFPGRNGDIAYSDQWGSDVELVTDLYRVCPDGSGERRLLPRMEGAGGVTFSPDGRWLAFSWAPYDGDRTRIHVGSAYGRKGRPISRPPRGAGDGGPVWSPRGGAVAFTRGTRRGRRSAVRIYRRGHGRYLARGSDPDWSVRDRIAFTRGEPSQPRAKVSVVPARGGDVRKLAPGWDPEWSPDGNRLLFATSTPSEATAVATMSADGSGQRVLGLGTPAGWAPDGGHVAFIAPEGHVTVVPASGGAVRRVGRTTAGGIVVFSPDGKWLAFGRGNDLYIAHVDGTQRTHVTTAPSLEDLSVVDWRPHAAGGRCG